MATELWWLDIFDSVHLVQPIRLLNHSYKDAWYAYCSVLYESKEHADNTDNRFESKICFENWK